MQTVNYHAHTTFSDGLEAPETYVLEAINQQMTAFGFSDHAPILFDPSRPRPYRFMAPQQLSDYLAEIDRLKEVYSGQIQIFKSLEVDYVPGVASVDMEHIRSAELDYTIGAVHFLDYYQSGRPCYFAGAKKEFIWGLEQLFHNDIKAYIRHYYSRVREMVLHSPPDIVAHLDLIKKMNVGECYFSEQAAWYQDEVRKTLDVIAKAGLILEVNTQGFYKHPLKATYPSSWVLKLANEWGIPIHLASDAHRPEDITKGFQHGIDMLHSIGVHSIAVFLDGCWIEQPIVGRYFNF